MALPVSPPPKSDDVAHHGWSGITVQIAWTLLSSGVKIRAEVLDAARRHVLYHLPATTQLPHAEDRAAHLAREFIAQARHKVRKDSYPGDAAMPLTERWSRAIESIRDRTTDAVFRMHYGDRRPLGYIERKLGVDRIAVEAARGGLREVLRRAARRDGLPLDSWSTDRLDRVLARLASWAPDACPPMYDVVNGAHRTHVRVCPRCNRMVRLVGAGALEASDLQAPTLKARPKSRMRVMALQFHPDGKCHIGRFRDALTAPHHAIGDDLVLIDAQEPDAIHTALLLAAEVGMPRRDHVRGAVVEGPGEWSRFGPIGPVGSDARIEVRGRPWGCIDGAGVLPEVLPAPPSSNTAWGLVGLMTLAAGAALYVASTAGMSPAPTASADFVPTADGVWAHFDVQEHQRVHIIALPGELPEPILLSDGVADKAELAVGDGTYRTLIPGPNALIVATEVDIDLPPLLASAATQPSPLHALSAEIRRIEPSADVFIHTR